ncbi:hypothetical protein D9M69_453900 [compost metagenome]
MLDLVHDQDHVGPGFVDDFGKSVGQRGAAGLANALKLEAELEAEGAKVGTRHALEVPEGGGARLLQLGQRLLYRGKNEGRRAALCVAPEVDVDDDRTFGLQGRDEVVDKKRRFSGAP